VSIIKQSGRSQKAISDPSWAWTRFSILPSVFTGVAAQKASTGREWNDTANWREAQGAG